MSNGERDRFGEKLKDAERGREEQYFAEQDKRLVEKMRGIQNFAGEQPTGRLACPQCSAPLIEKVVEGVAIDACPKCNGLWLSEGELNKIAKHENQGWIARWLRTP